MNNDNLILPDETISHIQSTLGGKQSKTRQYTANAFLEACSIVASCVGIQLKFFNIEKNEDRHATLLKLADQSRFRFRKIKLKLNWWQKDNGPLLGFLKNGAPVALIPYKETYLYNDPTTQEITILDATNITDVSEIAYYFYAPLPPERLTIGILLKHVYKIIKADLLKVIMLQIIMSLMSFAVPVATGYLFSTAIPYADKMGLTEVILALLVNAIVVTLFMFVQIISFYRIKFKTDVSIQSGLWDRLLRVPIQFFKSFEAGDLTNRISSIDSIQQEFTTNIITAISNITVIIFLLCFLLYVNATLTIIMLIPLALLMVVSIILTLRELGYLRTHFNLLGEVYAILLQLFSSIGKIKVAHRERKMFLLWSDKFTMKTIMFFKESLLTIISKVFNQVIILSITMLFFWFIIFGGYNMSIGIFMMYNAALSMLLLAILNIWNGIMQLMRVIPLYERTKPIREALPEDIYPKHDLANFIGSIELKNITFKYDEASEYVANNISLTIPAGSYIGIIGPSGVGKSTIVKLILGFETPHSGKIYYDGHDLETLNVQLIRKQLSVILQNSMLLPGTILDNIVGLNTGLGVQEAWKAAKLANIDEEIRLLPMGMQTIVSEGARTLSLGQRQRILIARAIVKSPKLFIFDEAMSGMDEFTLGKFQACIENLSVTRIVITQRPQLLAKADKIYVLDQGKVTLSGTYQEIKNEAIFKKLFL